MKDLAPAFTDWPATPALRRSVIATKAVPVAVSGFVIGHSILPNSWLHLGWLLLAGLFAHTWTDRTPHTKRRRVEAGALCIFLFLSWMTLRSFIQAPFMRGAEPDEIAQGVLGVVLLALFCSLVWQQARDDESLSAMGWLMGWSSALAALISIVLSYGVLPGHHAGERLTNLLVHGGLNPVCTGLIFGFAALWLAALIEKGRSPAFQRTAWAAVVLLHLAAFLSGSRGTMLALACGHAVLLMTRGWRRSGAAACVFVVTGMLYFTSLPLLTQLAPGSADAASVATAPSVTHSLQKAITRGDNGRLEIYRAGWQSMDSLWLGTGQWGMREVWQCELQPKTDLSLMSHLHSAFFATFVHGGIIGAGLLLMLLGLGIHRSCRLAARDDSTWAALLTFGCAGLLFDGESLASLATAPRFEGLLFWLPLTVILSRGSAISPPADS